MFKLTWSFFSLKTLNISVLFVFTVTALETVTGLYGKTVAIPCNYGTINAKDIMMIKWKYVSRSRGQWIQGCNIRVTASHAWTTPSLRACALEHISVPLYDTSYVLFYLNRIRNGSSLLLSPGQRRHPVWRPAGQAERPECVSLRHRWLPGPCEHGHELHPAAF